MNDKVSEGGRRPTRRTVLRLSAAAAVMGAAMPRAMAAQPPIRIGFNTSLTAGGVLAVSSHFKWFKKAGLDVIGVPFTNAPAQAAALIGGSLEMSIIGANGAMNVMAKRAAIISLDNLLNDVFLLAPTHGPIKEVSDLKGRRVGYVEGTVSQLLLYLALQRAGLRFSDVKAINLAPPAIVSTLNGGQIDAACIYLPFEAAIAMHTPVRVLARPSSFKDFALPMFWMANRTLLQKKPDVVVKLLEVKARANDWRKENLKKAAAIAAAYCNAPNQQPYLEQVSAETWLSSKEILDSYISGHFERWIGADEHTMFSAGIVKKEIPAGSFMELAADRKAISSYLAQQKRN